MHATAGWLTGGGLGMQRVAILSGGGSLPMLLADNIIRGGGSAHIVAVRGEAGANSDDEGDRNGKVNEARRTGIHRIGSP